MRVWASASTLLAWTAYLPSMSERKRNEYLDLRQRYQPEKVRLVIVLDFIFMTLQAHRMSASFAVAGNAGPQARLLGRQMVP